MSRDDAAHGRSLLLAGGVALFASPRGLIATFPDGRCTRIDLHDRAKEASLVASLAQRGRVEPAEHTGIAVLHEHKVLVSERILHVVDHLGLPVSSSASPVSREGALPVLVGWAYDPRFHEAVAAALGRRDRALVLCATSSGLWLAYDDATVRPCMRCALLLDSDLAKIAAAAEGLATATSSSPPAEMLSVATSWIARWRRRDCPLPAPGRALVFDVRDGTSAWQTYAAHPGCSCAERAPTTETPPDLDWEQASRRRFSPIMCAPSGAESGPARVVYRGARRPFPITPADFGVAMAGPPNARLRAFAEGIERFCMLHARPDVPATRACELDDEPLDEAAIRALLFRPEERAAPQFPFPEYSPEELLDWSWATRPRDGRRVLVPTSLVGRVPKGTTRLVHGTSNGYACHRRAGAAKRAALLEVVERDAVLLGWYLGRSLRRIDLDVEPSVEGQLFTWLATQDVDVPVVLAAALLANGATRVAAAAGTSFDEALTRALGELRALASAPASATRADGTASQGGPLEHQRYFDGAGRKELQRRAVTATVVGADELHARWPVRDDSLAPVVDALARVGLDAWFVERSIPELFGSGWHVVRALVPGCVELSWGAGLRRLASPRIRAALEGGERLTTIPHPFA